MSSSEKWRGLKSLVIEAVSEGSSAVERIHRSAAAKPFAILKAIPSIAAPVRGVEVVHDAAVVATYRIIRGATYLVGVALDATIDVVESRQRHDK